MLLEISMSCVLMCQPEIPHVPDNIGLTSHISSTPHIKLGLEDLITSCMCNVVVVTCHGFLFLLNTTMSQFFKHFSHAPSYLLMNLCTLSTHICLLAFSIDIQLLLE